MPETFFNTSFETDFGICKCVHNSPVPQCLKFMEQEVVKRFLRICMDLAGDLYQALPVPKWCNFCNKFLSGEWFSPHRLWCFVGGKEMFVRAPGWIKWNRFAEAFYASPAHWLNFYDSIRSVHFEVHLNSCWVMAVSAKLCVILEKCSLHDWIKAFENIVLVFQ